MTEATKDPATRKTVDKAMQILFAFSGSEPELSLTELSLRLEMHKSIVSRLVSTLCEWRLLERDASTKRLRLGMGAWQLGMLVANQNALYRAALPILGDLAERTRHSAHVTVRDRDSMLVIATAQSPEVLRVTMRQGDHRPLHATAAGKVMLAHMGADERRDLLHKCGLPRLTPKTISSLEKLEASLKQILLAGVAWNDGESVQGVGGVAAPIYDASGDVIGALTSVFPQSFVPETKRTSLANEVRASASELSALCGWNGNLNNRKAST